MFICGTKPQRTLQIVCRLPIFLFLEADAGQLNWKALVAWLLHATLFKCILSIVPAFEASQCYSIIIIKVGGGCSFCFCDPNDLLPAFFCHQLFDPSETVGIRSLCANRKRQE